MMASSISVNAFLDSVFVLAPPKSRLITASEISAESCIRIEPSNGSAPTMASTAELGSALLNS